MRKLKILVLLLLAVVLALPWLLGFEIENRYRGMLSQFEQAGYLLADHKYQRGFYTAEAESVLSLPVYTPQGKQSEIRLKLVSHINHGPYTPDLGWFGDLSHFSTTLFQQDKPVFPEVLDAQIFTVIGFSGDGKTTLNIPAIDQPLAFENNFYLSFAGLQGEINFNLVKASLSLDIAGNGLEFYAPGQGRLTIGKLTGQSDSIRGTSGLMLGEGAVSVAAIKLSDLQRDFELSVEGLAVSAATTESDGALNMQARYQLNSVNSAEGVYGPAVIDFELASVDAEAVARIQENIQEMQQNNVAPQQQGMAMMGMVMSVLPAILERNPALALKKLEVKTPEGLVKASLFLKAESMTIADVSDANRMVQKLAGDASLQIPEKIVREMMLNNARQQILLSLSKDSDPIEPAQLEELAEMSANSQLNALINQKFIERDGQYLVSVAALKAGLLSINGKTFPLPPMQ